MERLSPFRYPGGKSWLAPTIRRELANLRKTRLFIEPFAGGASVGLSVAESGLADRVLLTDLDRAVASFWRTVLSDRADGLARRVLEFEFTRGNVIALLDERPRSDIGRAFQVLVRNRVTRGGLLSRSGGLLKKGERGNGISSRWYPLTIATRIRRVALLRERVEFAERDGLEVIREAQQWSRVALFVDPPYTTGKKAAGRRLYNHADVDHQKLMSICSGLSCPVWLTYEDSIEVRSLARNYRFVVRAIPMRSTHHARHLELLLTNAASSKRA